MLETKKYPGYIIESIVLIKIYFTGQKLVNDNNNWYSISVTIVASMMQNHALVNQIMIH